jgi:hypothetical protein
VLALACLAVPVYQAAAADVEHRDYVIFVDGKEVGQSHFTINQQDDGGTYVRASAKVEIRGLFKYVYAVESQEWWKAGKLVGLKVQSNENGKKTDVLVAVGGDQLKLNVNGQERALRPDVWTTSYWKLADAKYHNKQVPVLDGDTGKEYAGQLQFVATEQLKVAGQPQETFHFRVTGIPNTTDLWFDRYHRLVRQEFTDLGHRTIVQLSAVRR